MSDARNRTAWIVAGVVLLSLAVRVAVVLAVPLAPPTEDAARYDMAARRLLAGRGFAYPLEPGTPAPAEGETFQRFLGTRENAFTMPGYAYLLAGLMRVTGDGEGRWLVARLANCLLTTLSLLLLFLIARRLADDRVALITLVGAACFPPFVWVVTYLLTEPLFVFLLLACVLATLVALEKDHWPYFAVAGALLGLTTLVRPTGLVWVPFVAAWMLLSRKYRFRRFLGMAAVTALALCLVMAPWWVRNAVRYGHPVWLTTASSNPLAAATSPSYAAGGRPRIPFPAWIEDDEVLGRYWAELARAQAVDIVRTDPLGYLRARLATTRYVLLNAWPAGPPGVTWLDGATRLYWCAVMALAVAGTIARRRDSLMWLFAALPLAIFVAHQLTLMLDRYLHPVLWLTFVPAAAGASALAAWRRRDARDAG